MRPVVCASCGTKNPRGSKYCNECGHELTPASTQLCPNCSASNPIDRLYCDNCGARLAADEEPSHQEEKPPDEESEAGRPEPFSLPARPPGQTGRLELDRELPAWLRTGEEDEGAADDSEAGSGSSEEEGSEHRPADDLPDWLLEEDEASDIFRSDKTTDELFLASASQQESGGGDEEEGDEDEEPEGAEIAPAPPQKGKAEEALSDWLAGAELGDEGEADEGLADWLQELEQEAEVAPAEEGLNDWLAELEDEDDEGESAEDEAAPGVGARLADLEEDEGRQPEQRPAVEAEDEGLADWLADLEDDATVEIDVPLDFEEEEPAGASKDDDIPGWLADLEATAGGEGETPPVDEEGSFSEEAVAGWLARLHGEETEAADEVEDVPEAGEAAPEGEEAEFPAWLASLDSEAIQEAQADDASPEDVAPEEAGDVSQVDDVPDWLAVSDVEEEGAWAAGEAAGEETSEVDDLPDWLAAMDADAEEEAAAATEEEPEEALPEWLAGEEEWGAEQKEAAAEEMWLPEPGEDTPIEEASSEQALEEEAPEEEALPADEIPDWLQEVAPEAGVRDVEDEGEDLTAILGAMDAGDEMPAWLMEAPDEEAPETPPEEDEFLAAFEDAALEEDAITPEEEAQAGEEGLFDWSEVEAPSEEGAAAPFEEEASIEGEIDFAAAAEEALEFGEPFDLTVEMEDSDQVSAEDLPDWLGDVMADVDEEAPAGEEAGVPAATEGTTPDLENVPEQLAGAELPEWLEDSLPEEAAPAEPAPAEPTPLDEMPEWIQAAGQSFLDEAQEEVPAAGIEDQEEIAEYDLDLATSGEWEDLLEGLPPPEPTAEEVREAEIPEWVQALKPQALTGEAPETREPQTPAETSGPLAGLHGVIGVEPAVTEARSTSPMAPLAPSKEQEQQAALLRQLTRSEESEAIVVASAAETAGSPWVRVLLALLLLAAVLTGLFVPGLLETTPNATGVAQAQEAIAAANGRPVLVAFDYTPATAAVLDGQARLVLEALAGGDSPVLFISQSPAGLALAQQAVDQVEGLESHRLGYLPGEAIGLRRLTACLETGSNCRPIAGPAQREAVGVSAADLGLIVVFAADRDSLINWIEQVDAATTVPMVAGVTQALAPVASPYMTSGQLDGLLAGFPATAALQAESGEMSNRARAELDMLTLAQWLTVVLFIVGNLLYLAFGSRRSRRAEQRVEGEAR